MKPDFRGARGANAGDDFHELWALRQALSLLDPDTQLAAVTVEGLRAEDETGVPKDTWDGVDCTFYYGGTDAASANRIIIDQLKYSSSDPQKKWTVARITHSSGKSHNNSVIGKLAKAFQAVGTLRPDLRGTDNLKVRLVSNQPVDPAVQRALPASTASNSKTRDNNHVALRSASGLSPADFDIFSESFDLSETGQHSRISIDEKVITTIASWTEDDARLAVDHLRRFVRLAMMPEAKREYITRESILAQLGFADVAALFPCPSAIKKSEHLVSRGESHQIVDLMLAAKQRICFHGAGGCGKTTLLQDIESQLPAGSIVITYDCYGGGRYLDSDAYRHRPHDAFLQLSNELAQQLRSPLLLTKNSAIDYPRVFKKRLDRASEIVASQSPDALLVIVADAADNSVTAANTHIPPEPSFVYAFARLGDIPANVRLVLTCRTSRLTSLNLPPTFEVVGITGFSRFETGEYVRLLWPTASEEWLDDFHHLASGNPRVETYALGDEPERALDYLRPHGKDLDGIFLEQMIYAKTKLGTDLNIEMFCAGLVGLPRPVPVRVLAAITELSAADITDLCLDLAPGIRLKNDLISFADEDFEHFLRAEGESQFNLMNSRIADYLAEYRRSDSYSATHVASALLNADRGAQVIELISAEQEPAAVGDPVLRREVQLERLRLAMKVSRDAGSIADSLLIVLVGAEAVKTDAAIRKMLVDNPDLAASFARDTTSRLILRDADEIENHGSLLFHFMAADSRRGDSISVREGVRQVRAWLQRRETQFKEEERAGRHPHWWSIDISDIVADTEAVLRTDGPQVVVDHLRRWRPRGIAHQVAIALSFKLIAGGESNLVESCLEYIPAPWDLFVITPLALAGKEVEVGRLESSLRQLLRRGLINVDRIQPTYRDEDPVGDYHELIISACEVVVARGGDVKLINPILEKLSTAASRRIDTLYTSNITRIDITLRAHALLQRLQGSEVTIATYLIPALPPDDSLSEPQLEQVRTAQAEKSEELQRFIGPFISLYDMRAQLLAAGSAAVVSKDLASAISESRRDDYRLRREFRLSDMRTQAALAVSRLMALPSLDRDLLYQHSLSTLGQRGPFSASETRVSTNFSMSAELHEKILTVSASRAREVLKARVSADEKISALVQLARLLSPLSQSDAEGLFNEAVRVAGEVNTEAMWEIDTFAPLAKRAADAMDSRRQRSTACAIATIATDAAIRLEGEEGFPWPNVGRALGNLDVSVAFAAMARWEDSAIIDRDNVLPGILVAALKRQFLSAEQVIALMLLLRRAEIDLVESIAQRIAELETVVDVDLIVDEVARQELLQFGKGKRAKITQMLLSLPLKERRVWLSRLVRATDFRAEQTSNSEASHAENSPALNEFRKKEEEILKVLDWSKHRFVDPSEINEFVSGVFANAKAVDTFVSVSQILDRMAEVVKLSDRVAHLEALAKSQSETISYYDLGQIIPTLVEKWGDAPSVANWCRDRLLSVVTDLLPAFVRYLYYDQSSLPRLLARSGASNEAVCAALLDGIARNVDALDARTLYALVGLIARHCTPEAASTVLEKYTHRLIDRIAIEDREHWDLADIPDMPTQGLARFLYALMGDTDVRNRWRAGHAVRCLARLNDSSIVNELRLLYARTEENSYRRPDAPFYWLAARLWLIISLDRIASENPAAVATCGTWLFGIATNFDFPHVLIRAFARSAVLKLVDASHLILDAGQNRAIARVNTSSLRRKKQVANRRVFDRYDNKERHSRRFTFNTTDTLPYWYSGATTAFADLDFQKFLDIAEHWIVDHWNVRGDPWEWNAEPRQNRFSERLGGSMDHRHGDLPTIERFHTYLEWHAMWCAIGELMQTHALTKLGEDDYDALERRLARNQLTVPPLWLADLLGPKPLRTELWDSPREVEEWMTRPSEAEFIAEMLAADCQNSVVVDGQYETRSHAFRLKCRIQTALVSPSTARALVRALQTSREVREYELLLAGGDFDINNPPYELTAWLLSDFSGAGIDERDPLRYDVSHIQSGPSPETISTLGLKQQGGAATAWYTSDALQPTLLYEAWGETGWDERDDFARYGDDVRSSGSRLRITSELLKELLTKTGRDLIAEVRITKRNKGYYDYSKYEDKAKEETFVEILLFRKDGAIEDSNGRIGTWAASGH
jgi:hypothetical protein